MTVTQDPLVLTIVPHHADLREGWRKQTAPAVKLTASATKASHAAKSYLVSPISHPAARYSSVIPLHGLLPDLPCEAVSPTGSVLVAIISPLTRVFASTLAARVATCSQAM